MQRKTGPLLGRSWKVAAAAVAITITIGYRGVCLDLIIFILIQSAGNNC